MQHLKLILIQDVEELVTQEEQESCLQELLASLLSSNAEKARVVALDGAIDERQDWDSFGITSAERRGGGTDLQQPLQISLAHTECFVMVADERLCNAFMASMT
ncbi:hypothetical protein QOT17_000456 [Balamuthia mandrillaris]